MNNIPQIFDKNLVKLHRERSLKQEDKFLLHEFAERLADRLNDFSCEFDNALILGARCGMLRKYISKKIPNIIEADLSEELSGKGGVVINDGILPFDNNSFDLIISFLELHNINDVPGILRQIYNILKPGGIFIGNMFGDGTLRELREVIMEVEIKHKGGISPRISPFIDVKNAGSLLQRAGFKNLVSDSETVTVEEDDFTAIVQGLRALGETSALLAGKSSLNKTMAHDIAALYQNKFGDGDSINATFELINVTGFK